MAPRWECAVSTFAQAEHGSLVSESVKVSSVFVKWFGRGDVTSINRTSSIHQQDKAITGGVFWVYKHPKIKCLASVFTALHQMQTRSSDENSVHLSVCQFVPSVKRVHFDKTEEKPVQIFIPCKRSFSLVFWEEEWLVEGDPFNLKFLVNRPPLERNLRFWTNNRS